MMIMLIDFRFPTMPKVLTWCHAMRLNKINRVIDLLGGLDRD